MKTEWQHKKALAAKEAAHAVFAERLQLENNKLRVELHQVKEENEKLHTSHEALEKLLATSEMSYNAEQRAHNATRLAACRIARALFEATAAIDNLGKQLLDDVAEPTPDSESAADA